MKSNDIYYIEETAKWISKDSEFISLVEEVTLNPHFTVCWGGLKGKHHDFTGGLAKHTKEVIQLCLGSRATLELDVDIIELFLSALFHDIGKTYDYIVDIESTSDLNNPAYKSSPHKRNIHHISRSALIWSHAVDKYPLLRNKYHDSVLHNILSHHGQRAWGSPVAPNSKAAWLLHLCDGISARMNDCDRLDLVKEKPEQQ